jgi:hypothetical protein
MRIRWILLLALVACLSLVIPALSQKTDESELLKATDEMISAAARLRGLEPKAPILRGVKSRAEIAQYLNEHVQTEYDPKQLNLEGRFLKKLGLIPAAMNYKDFLLKLLAEQVAGFYDTEKKTFYIAAWLPLKEQKPAMIHELTHALQDQHFEIGKVMKTDHDENNDDRTLAHSSFWEGDATIVMLEYLLEPNKAHFADLPDLADIMRLQTSVSLDGFPVFKDAPAFIRESLLFPYGYGSSFLQQIWKHTPSWQSVNKIYSDLPASTEQILHPEKYYEKRDEPKSANAEELAAKLGKGWKIVYKNVLGEFSLGLLLNLHLNDERSRKAATGWGGDQVLLLENEKGKDVVLIGTLWDTADDSEKFYFAMDEWFRQHYPKTERVNENPKGFSLIKDGEYNSLRREGAAVNIIIGLPESEGRKLEKKK